MNSLKFILTKLLIVSICVGCLTTHRTDKASIYFKSFNLFNLSGLDIVTASSIENKQNPEFVKVTYKNKLPYTITYHFAEREVVLNLDSSFKVNDRDIFVYYTGNLLGGKAGKQREYSFHYIDNGYKLYINLSDTILVKSYDNIDTKSSEAYHYLVDVYTQVANQVNHYSLMTSDAYMFLGTTYEKLKNYKLANDMYQRELKISEEIESTDLIMDKERFESFQKKNIQQKN